MAMCHAAVPNGEIVEELDPVEALHVPRMRHLARNAPGDLAQGPPQVRFQRREVGAEKGIESSLETLAVDERFELA